MNTATFPKTLFTQKMQFEIQSIICHCKTLIGLFFIFFFSKLFCTDFTFHIDCIMERKKQHILAQFNPFLIDLLRPRSPKPTRFWSSGLLKNVLRNNKLPFTKKTCFKFCAALNSLTLTRGLAPGPHCWWVLQHGSSPRGIFHFPRPQRGQRTLFPRKISNSAEPVNHMAHGNPRGETDDDDDTHIAESHVGAKLRATSVRCGHMDRVPGLLSAACIL